MKFSKLALAGALAGLLSVGTAYAQSGLGQPGPAQPTAYDYNSYYSQDQDEQAGSKERGVEGEADPQAAAPAGPATPAPMPGAGTFLNPCCCLGEQWKLIDHMPNAKCRGINVAAGWPRASPGTPATRPTASTAR